MTLRYIYNYYLDTCWHPSNYISLNFTKLTLEKLRSISSIIISHGLCLGAWAACVMFVSLQAEQCIDGPSTMCCVWLRKAVL